MHDDNLFLLGFTDDYGGHGNSYHASGGRGNKRAQMRYCLHLMRSMVSASDEACNQDLVDQGAINQLLGRSYYANLYCCYVLYCHVWYTILQLDGTNGCMMCMVVLLQ